MTISTRSAAAPYPHGLDPQRPLLDIVWWVNKELIEHATEMWYVRDLYAARG